MSKVYMKGNEVIGYTPVPLERLVYDPELDFERREAAPVKRKSDKVRRTFFENPEEAAGKYLSGVQLEKLAAEYNMTPCTARQRLLDMGVQMRSRGWRSKELRKAE